MKLSACNIAWTAEHDDEMYQFLSENGFSGVEIAPTRIFPENPYDHLAGANAWSRKLKKEYGLSVPSIQSIWYGQKGNMFNPNDRQQLIDYTKKAVDFAEAVGAYNLVFGNPKARNIPDGMDYKTAEDLAVAFFREIGDYAASHNAVIAIEANPVIYNTNFINRTVDAVEMIRKIDSKSVRLNLDIGTDIYNYHLDDGENPAILSDLEQAVKYVDHVHISEPGLKPVRKRSIHKEILKCLNDISYSGFVSIEMGKTDSLDAIRNAVRYVKELAESA